MKSRSRNLDAARRARIALLGALCLIGACARPEPQPPATAVSRESRESFFHFIVDAHPPGGEECCTDVAAIGDLNGDGYLDLVIGSEGAKGAGLVWYQYPNWERHDIARGAFTTDGHAIDFDADGDLDIVVGEIERGTMWFENVRNGREWTPHLIGAGYAHDIAIADLDGDRALDVVVADKKRVIAYFNAGNTFRREEIVTRAGEGLQAIDIDADGDIDLLYSNAWIENTGSAGKWVVHEIDPTWTADTRIQAADIDGDGRLDVVLSGSEGEAGLAWFSWDAAAGPNAWKKHDIGTETYVGVHSLRVADLDLDGDMDVIAAEMGTSPAKRVVAYLNEGSGAAWQQLTLATHGSHNMVAGDVDQDGDIDLFGKNYDGKGRFIEYWENRTSDLRLVPQRQLTERIDAGEWLYRPIDLQRPATDARKFGLLVRDVNRDGFEDVIAGGTLYVHPGGNGQQPWQRIVATEAGDIIDVTPIARHGWPVMLAITSESLQLIEATSPDASTWTETRLHRLPAGRTQGFTTAPRDGAGDYDLYFTHATSLFRLRVQGDPPRKWRLSELRKDVQEEEVVTGDLDGDGNLDVLVVAEDGKRLFWLKADGEGLSLVRTLGASLRWIDRVAIADLNADGRLDIVYTEETGALEYAGRLVWLEAPADARQMPWKPHTLATFRSLNSLSVQDVDGDGRADIIAAEHTDLSGMQPAEDNFTGIFHNSGDGTFRVEVVEVGPHSSHIGAKLLRTQDAASPFDIVSVGWAQECCVHRWQRVPRSADTTE